MTFAEPSSVTIASGQTTSGALYCGGKVPCTLGMPAAFTGTAVSFLVAFERNSPTYRELRVGGSPYSITAGASKAEALTPTYFAGVQWLKIVSNSAEADDRAIYVARRKGDR